MLATNAVLRNAVCRYCAKTGHTQAVCLKRRVATQSVQHITKRRTLKHNNSVPKLKQSLRLNGHLVSFEIDTGAGENFVSSDVWKLLGKPALCPSYGRYESATKHPLPVLGSIQATATVNSSGSDVTTQGEHPLQFVVTDVPRLNLLGRDAIRQLQISVDALLNTGTKHTQGPAVHAVFDHLHDSQLLNGRQISAGNDASLPSPAHAA